MTEADIRNAVKRKYRITAATLDTDINEAVAIAVEALAPFVKQSTVNNALTANSDTDSLTIPVAGADLVKIYTKGSSGVFEKFDSYSKHGDVIYLRSWLEDATAIRLHLKIPFTVATLAAVPVAFKRSIVDLACGEFATMLAGDKSRYNIYSQSNGARAVSNMLDLAEFYEAKATRQLVRLASGEALG